MSLYGKILEASIQTVLQEECLYRDNKKNDISVHINATQTTNFDKDPYIKVYNNSSYSKATEVARIYLRDAGIDYSHSDHFDNLKITSSIGKRLNEIFDSMTTIKIIDDKGNPVEKQITVYEYMWIILNNTFNNKIQYIPKPDFTKCYIRKK